LKQVAPANETANFLPEDAKVKYKAICSSARGTESAFAQSFDVQYFHHWPGHAQSNCVCHMQQNKIKKNLLLLLLRSDKVFQSVKLKTIDPFFYLSDYCCGSRARDRRVIGVSALNGKDFLLGKQDPRTGNLS